MAQTMKRSAAVALVERAIREGRERNGYGALLDVYANAIRAYVATADKLAAGQTAVGLVACPASGANLWPRGDAFGVFAHAWDRLTGAHDLGYGFVIEIEED
jgi:hypothetical protein